MTLIIFPAFLKNFLKFHDEFSKISAKVTDFFLTKMFSTIFVKIS